MLATKENTDQHFNLWSLRDNCSWCCTLQWKVFETNYSSARRRLISTMALSTLSSVTVNGDIAWCCCLSLNSIKTQAATPSNITINSDTA